MLLEMRPNHRRRRGASARGVPVQSMETRRFGIVLYSAPGLGVGTGGDLFLPLVTAIVVAHIADLRKPTLKGLFRLGATHQSALSARSAKASIQSQRDIFAQSLRFNAAENRSGKKRSQAKNAEEAGKKPRSKRKRFLLVPMPPGSHALHGNPPVPTLRVGGEGRGFPQSIRVMRSQAAHGNEEMQRVGTRKNEKVTFQPFVKTARLAADGTSANVEIQAAVPAAAKQLQTAEMLHEKLFYD